MRLNIAVPEAHVAAPVLDAALESVTRLNEALITEGKAPTFHEALPSGIRWQPEPPGQEHFDHALTVLGRKWGDCDDLAPWHAASLRATGEDPDARAIVQKSGPKRWHAVVRRSDGSIDDPSRDAGMGRTSGVVGAALPVMPHQHSVVGGAYIVRPSIAMRPVPGGWQARADLPWRWREHLAHDPAAPQDYAMAALHAAPVPSTALTGALDGICELATCAGFADPEHVTRLAAIADAIDGADYEELAALYGDEHAEGAIESVVGFFGGLKKLAKGALKIARPFAGKALQFVPGVGPVASMAFDAATASMVPRGAAAATPSPVPAAAFNLRCTPFT